MYVWIVGIEPTSFPVPDLQSSARPTQLNPHFLWCLSVTIRALILFRDALPPTVSLDTLFAQNARVELTRHGIWSSVGYHSLSCIL